MTLEFLGFYTCSSRVLGFSAEVHLRPHQLCLSYWYSHYCHTHRAPLAALYFRWQTSFRSHSVSIAYWSTYLPNNQSAWHCISCLCSHAICQCPSIYSLCFSHTCSSLPPWYSHTPPILLHHFLPKTSCLLQSKLGKRLFKSTLHCRLLHLP